MRITTGLLAAALAALPATARAELSCHDYLRGFQLEDPDVLAQATALAAPLIQGHWRSSEMLTDPVGITDRMMSTLTGTPALPESEIEKHLVLRQLARDCQALPDDTLEAIIATHIKAMQWQAKQEEAEHQAALKAQQEAQQDADAAANAEQERIKNYVAPPEDIFNQNVGDVNIYIREEHHAGELVPTIIATANGNTIYTEDGYQNIFKVYHTSTSDFVTVITSDGGNCCVGLFRVIQIHTGHVTLSPEMGDSPEFKNSVDKPDVVRVYRDTIYVSFPPADDHLRHTYTFSDGHLSDLTKRADSGH